MILSKNGKHRITKCQTRGTPKTTNIATIRITTKIAFLFLTRNVFHHCREWRIEYHEIFTIFMSQRMVIRNMIPKILRWADFNLEEYRRKIGINFCKKSSSAAAHTAKTIILQNDRLPVCLITNDQQPSSLRDVFRSLTIE
jgi:hypothetical protein